MRGIEALEYFIETWNGKIREFDEVEEFDALIEYAFGNSKKCFNSKVSIERFFERKIHLDLVEEINEFLPEEVEFDPLSGNMYIKRNLFEIRIAPKIC